MVAGYAEPQTWATAPNTRDNGKQTGAAGADAEARAARPLGNERLASKGSNYIDELESMLNDPVITSSKYSGYKSRADPVNSAERGTGEPKQEHRHLGPQFDDNDLDELEDFVLNNKSPISAPILPQ